MTFTTRGTLHYDPPRTMRNEHEARILVLSLEEDDLLAYYQWLIKKRYGQWLALQSPLFGAHVTVVRPQEVPPEHPLWGKYEGMELEVHYQALERHWEFWSLNIYSDQLVHIRKELSLNPLFRLHLTVGRQFAWQPWEKIAGVNHDRDYVDCEPTRHNMPAP